MFFIYETKYTHFIELAVFASNAVVKLEKIQKFWGIRI